MGKQMRFWFAYLQEKRQVLRSDKDVDKLDDKKDELKVEGIPKTSANTGKGSKHGHGCHSPRDKELPSAQGA